MLQFKKKLTNGAARRTPAARELTNLTVALISEANRAESMTQPGKDVETTSTDELVVARELIARQKALSSAITKAKRANMSVSQIRAEIVEPVIERSVVGDVAWIMLRSALEAAEADQSRSSTSAGFGRAANL